MKKLCKIKLNDAAIMTDSEMKYIFGGTGSSTGALEECKANDKEDGCASEGAKCKFNEKLEGKCEWKTYTGSEGTASSCNCVHYVD